MTIFGKTAIKAFEYVKSGHQADKAWRMAICEFSKSEYTQAKGCPRVAFCGLVSDDKRWGNMENAIYARKALDILRTNPNRRYSKDELWRLIGSPTKSQNGQLDVVLALWDSKLIS